MNREQSVASQGLEQIARAQGTWLVEFSQAKGGGDRRIEASPDNDAYWELELGARPSS